jgi:ApbE superfamily uncharacterized protein (UPF0280 family)
VNPVAVVVPDEPFYTPISRARDSAHATLARLLVAAHRTLCSIPGVTNPILSTTKIVISFLYSSPDFVWEMSRASVPVRVAPAAPAAPAAVPAARRMTPTEASRAFVQPSGSSAAETARAMLAAMNATTRK